MIGVLPAVLAAFGFALFQHMLHRTLRGIDVYRATFVLLSIAAVALGLISVVTTDLSGLRDAPVGAFASAGAAGMVHFFFGWTLLGASQQRLGPSGTGTLLGTVPVFGAMVAAALLGEPFTLVHLLAVLIVAGGVMLVALSRPSSGGDQDRRVSGIVLGLATAGCWSISPVLIRGGLAGLPSPVFAASVGLATSAVVYGIALAVTSRRRQRPVVTGQTRRLLVAGGVTVGLAVWLLFTAYNLAEVAVVLSVMQLIPATVVLLARWLAPETAPTSPVRLWAGVGAVAAGALILILVA